VLVTPRRIIAGELNTGYSAEHAHGCTPSCECDDVDLLKVSRWQGDRDHAARQVADPKRTEKKVISHRWDR
jgi:hypothetical protein